MEVWGGEFAGKVRKLKSFIAEALTFSGRQEGRGSAGS